MTFKIETRDLFTSPADSFICHSVNCRGTWGGGIAKFMKDKYPKNNEAYRQHCFSYSDERLIGSAFIAPIGSPAWNERRIVSLFTSIAFGVFKDPVHIILENTKDALIDLFEQFNEEFETAKEDAVSFMFKFPEINIYSNKFNSGLFNVPWKETQNVLCEQLDIFEKQSPEIKINWTVCDWN